MGNPSRKNDERNHHSTYSGNNSMMLPQSSTMKHNVGIAIFWNVEEQAILDDGLIRYASLPIIQRYAKIASQLQEKTIRDVAMRCKLLYKNKRRKEDHNRFGKARLYNKGIIDMVMTSNLTEEDVITKKLLEQNKQLLNQISANLTSLRLEDNLALLARSGENIRTILNNLNENVPETMKHMPPLPEKLNDELADSVYQIYQSYHE